MSDWTDEYAPRRTAEKGEEKVLLSLDGRDGQFYRGSGERKQALGRSLQVAIVAVRHVRTLFVDDYRKGVKPVVACSSWNGRDAFGLGRRPDEDEHDWMSDVAQQKCLGCPTAEWEERTVRGKKKNIPPLCDPQSWALVLWRSGSDLYTLEPAWLRAAKRFSSLLDTTYARLKDGQRHGGPRPYHRITEFVSIEDGDYWKQVTGDGYEVPAEKREKMDAWINAEARDLWAADMERGEERARSRFHPDRSFPDKVKEPSPKSEEDDIPF